LHGDSSPPAPSVNTFEADVARDVNELCGSFNRALMGEPEEGDGDDDPMEGDNDEDPLTEIEGGVCTFDFDTHTELNSLAFGLQCSVLAIWRQSIG
jgi:hypothetical protein